MSIVNLTEQAKQHMATMLKEHNKPAIRLGLKKISSFPSKTYDLFSIIFLNEKNKWLSTNINRESSPIVAAVEIPTTGSKDK